MKIIRVTKTEFEFEDGRVYEHPVELDTVLSVEKFQEIYDSWEKAIKKQLQLWNNF